METAIIRRWLYALLGPALVTAGWVWTPTGGAQRPRLAHGAAEAGMPYPLVVYQMLSPGTDLIVIGGWRIWSDTLWLVKAVAQSNSTSAIEPTAKQIDTLLHRARGGADGGIVLNCERERPHDLPELTGGTFYSNLGGEYRIKAQGA